MSQCIDAPAEGSGRKADVSDTLLLGAERPEPILPKSNLSLGSWSVILLEARISVFATVVRVGLWGVRALSLGTSDEISITVGFWELGFD